VFLFTRQILTKRTYFVRVETVFSKSEYTRITTKASPTIHCQKSQNASKKSSYRMPLRPSRDHCARAGHQDQSDWPGGSRVYAYVNGCWDIHVLRHAKFEPLWEHDCV